MDLITFIDTNLTASSAIVLGYILGAAVQALPKPKEGASGFYQFIYTFAHILSANWKHAMQQYKERKEGE